MSILLPLFAVRLLFKPLIITGVAQFHASDSVINKFLNAPNIAQNNIDSCIYIICGKVVFRRASDIKRHIKRHNPSTKFVTDELGDSCLAFPCGRDIWGSAD